MPSQLLRGRITYALYQQMGVTDCVTSNIDGYVETALRLANDRDWHNEQSRQIVAGSHTLFDNRQVVREYESFFENALTSIAQA